MNNFTGHSATEGRKTKRPCAGHRASPNRLCFGLVSVMLLVAAGCASHSSARAPQPLPCQVVGLKGQARSRQPPDISWKPLSTRYKIVPPTVIETAANSHVDLALAKKSKYLMSPTVAAAIGDPAQEKARALEPVPLWPISSMTDPHLRRIPYRDPCYSPNPIRIWDNTRLDVLQLKQSPDRWGQPQIEDVQLDLQAGHIFFVLSQLPQSASYKVHIPEWTITVGKGIYDINVDGIIRVDVGLATATRDDGTQSQKIESEQMFDARTGVLSHLPISDRTSIP